TFCARHLEGLCPVTVYSDLRQALTNSVPRLDAARPILDALAQPVVVTDPEATILYWNQAATDLYGFGSDEALGQSIHALLESPSSLAPNESAAPRRGRRGSWTSQLEGRSRSGRAVTVLMT